MKFTRRYTTNWHDTGIDRAVRPSRLLVYMQETSSAHVASSGYSLGDLRSDRGLAFILSKISLSVYTPLRAYEDIDVQTWTCSSKGYSFIRCFRILRGEEIIAEAHTVWALVDINNKTICRVEDCGFKFEDEEPLMLDLPKRFKLPSDRELCELGTKKILYSDIDNNMHMNNTRYPDMLCDHMPVDKIEKIKGMTLSFLREAAFEDTISINGCEKDGIYYFRTFNTADDVCLEAQVVLKED